MPLGRILHRMEDDYLHDYRLYEAETDRRPDVTPGSITEAERSFRLALAGIEQVRQGLRNILLPNDAPSWRQLDVRLAAVLYLGRKLVSLYMDTYGPKPRRPRFGRTWPWHVG
ncbi:hypothetical protein JNJ66_04920 [Candidatus Saccharibacteria bacterium]|nr:hypothetical protein [Candidatus Saccharibacteria bacterium]